jgi:hypothetical protein
MIELAPEDALRINVLLAKRWARMGQNRIENLDDLLVLGEPSAVIAVAYAEALTDDLARRAWWAMEDAENARQMLRVSAVVEGDMAPQLAAYLVEFLPFETEVEKIMESVRLVLQPGIISTDAKQDLWKKARRKSAMYVGFLAALPNDLPGDAYPHAQFAQVADGLKALAAQGNKLAGLLHQVLSAQGQLWLDTLRKILEKPGNQDVVNWTLDVIAGYFNAAAAETRLDYTIEQLMDEAVTWADSGLDEQVTSVLAEFPQLKPQLQALRVLSGAGYNMVRPVFSKSTAIGSLMRRQLEPVLTPLRQQIECLQTEISSS